MTIPARALMPDYLRLFALFGIVVVNVQFMAFSSLQGLAVPAGESVSDAIVLWLVNGLALLKTYGLFSFMFGVGLGFLMRSAARRGLAFGRVYRNRMAGLAVPRHRPWLPVLSRRYPRDLRGRGVGALSRSGTGRCVVSCALGAGLLVLQVLIAPPLLLGAPEVPADIVALEHALLAEGGFAGAVLFRSVSFAVILPSFLVIQGISALGWFCLGLAALRSGMIDDAGHALWRRARRWCLIPGVALSLIGAAMWQWGPTVPGVVLTIVVAPLATLGYLGLIAALARPPVRSWPARLRRADRA